MLEAVQLYLTAVFDFELWGPSAVVYTTFENSCGSVPNRLPESEMFRGGEITGNPCLEIRSAGAGTLEVFLGDEAFNFNSFDRVWFNLSTD